MARSWSSLPTEILQFIFEHLEESSDVNQCQLVCKNWSTSAQQRLYKNVDLLGDSYAISFLRSIQNSSLDVGARVKILKFSPNGGWSTDILASSVDKVMHSCPNGQVFILGKYNVPSVWNTIINELSQGRWRSIKHIPSPTDKSDMDKYSKVVLERQGILNSLTIWTSRGEITHDLVGNLSMFANLKHFDVRIEQSLEISDLETVLNFNFYSQLEKITYNTFNSTFGAKRNYC